MAAFDANKVLALSSIFAPVASGIASGIAGGKDRKQNEQTLAYQRQQDEIRRREDALNRLLTAQQNAQNATAAARGGQIANLQGLGSGDLERSLGILNATKLGDEQELVQRNATRLALGQNMQNRAMPTAYGGVTNPFVGMDLTAFGPGATQAAIEERRKMLAGVQPDFQFGSLDGYGLEDTNNVASYQDIARGKRSANEAAVTQLVNDQLEMARTAGQSQIDQVAQFNAAQDAEAAARTQQALAAPEQEKKSGGFMGFLKGLGKGALKLAPFALSAIPGIGPVAGLALRAGLGAAGGALDGGGWKGALTGGALSAIPMGGQAPGGTNVIHNLRQAILSPQGIGQVAGAFTPGAAGQAIQTASRMLPGPNYRVPNNPSSTTTAPWITDPGRLNRVEGFADRTNPTIPDDTFVNQNNQFLTPQPSQGRMTNVLRPPARPLTTQQNTERFRSMPYPSGPGQLGDPFGGDAASRGLVRGAVARHEALNRGVAGAVRPQSTGPIGEQWRQNAPTVVNPAQGQAANAARVQAAAQFAAAQHQAQVSALQQQINQLAQAPIQQFGNSAMQEMAQADRARQINNLMTKLQQLQGSR